jgi:RNA polymerase sigma-70 factor (ECF subfamily)
LRLGDLIAASSIAAPRVHALMALMALQAARLTARTDDAGDLILLEEQDRGRWDQRLTAAGFHHLELSIAGDDVSQYHAQAAIAAAHARGAGWPEVLDLYEQLYAITPSPVVALNRAVAIARVRGPAEALQSIESLELPGYYLYLAVRGHLLLELGARTDAGACFRAALECRCSEPERRFLQRKMAECAVAASGGGRG